MSSIFHCLVACTVEVQSVKMLNPVSYPISDHYFDLFSKKYAIKKLFFYGQVSVHEASFSRIQIMTPRATTRGTFLSRCRLKLRDFLQIIYQMVPDP